MKDYLTLIVLVSLVGTLSFFAGASQSTVRAADERGQFLKEINFGHAVSSASEKFRVLQDLQVDERDRAMVRLSKLIDLDLLEASRNRPPEFRYLESVGIGDWAALKETRRTLQMGHVDVAENAYIESEIDLLMDKSIRYAEPNHTH